MRIRIIDKGLILIFLQLLFVLGFIGLVNHQKIASQDAIARSEQSKEIIAHTASLSEDLLDAQSSVRGYVITGEKQFLEPYELAARRIPDDMSDLQRMTGGTTDQSVRAAALVKKAAERLKVLEEVKNLVDAGRTAEAVASIKSGRGKRLMDEFRQMKNEFLAEEQRLNELRQSTVDASWERFDMLIVGGGAVNLLVAFGLAFLFSRGIARRLQVLTENARALADGSSLTPPLDGNDEIAELDQSFHQMAAALQKSQSELESKVEERTRELSEATEKITRLNEDLERRVADRTARLEAANKELEAFSYSVSHDLRAPLRAIDGFSRILLEDYSDRLDDEGNRILNVVRSNAQNMGQLIDDLLAFSRLGRKQLDRVTIDMKELVQDVCSQLELNHLDIKIGDLPPARADRTLLRQVWINLLSNAAKYSSTRETPQIEIGGEALDGEVTYCVRDNGVGFDMKYAGKLFGVFQRLHSVEEFDGTGVGLAIVQRIVHRHGGRVRAEAEVDNGAAFYFTLPQTAPINQEETYGYE